MDPFLEEHARRNTQSRDAWVRYADHRQRVSELLSTGVDADHRRLCVLGAGNCNDVDLPRLARCFAQIHLVDLDSAALEFGLAQQAVQESDRVVCVGGVDVTGIAEQLAGVRPGALGKGDLDGLVQSALQASTVPANECFDVVASVCLMTQVIDSMRIAIGEMHPGFLELLQAVRTRHLRMLIDLLRPGGRLVFISDVVSSVSYPDLSRVPAAELGRLVTRLVVERNFFSGVNPFVILDFFRTDPVIASQVENAELITPWLWDFGPRVYAVYAFCARRRITHVGSASTA